MLKRVNNILSLGELMVMMIYGRVVVVVVSSENVTC